MVIFSIVKSLTERSKTWDTGEAPFNKDIRNTIKSGLFATLKQRLLQRREITVMVGVIKVIKAFKQLK